MICLVSRTFIFFQSHSTLSLLKIDMIHHLSTCFLQKPNFHHRKLLDGQFNSILPLAHYECHLNIFLEKFQGHLSDKKVLIIIFQKDVLILCLLCYSFFFSLKMDFFCFLSQHKNILRVSLSSFNKLFSCNLKLFHQISQKCFPCFIHFMMLIELKVDFSETSVTRCCESLS